VDYLSREKLHKHQTEKNFFNVGKSSCARVIEAEVKEKMNALS
jgi:hypothetical protein